MVLLLSHEINFLWAKYSFAYLLGQSEEENARTSSLITCRCKLYYIYQIGTRFSTVWSHIKTLFNKLFLGRISEIESWLIFIKSFISRLDCFKYRDGNAIFLSNCIVVDKYSGITNFHTFISILLIASYNYWEWSCFRIIITIHPI